MSGLKEVQFLINLSNYACPLQNLKKLDLRNLPNFVGLVNLGLSSSPLEAAHFRGHQRQLIPPEIFSFLQSLSIRGCHKLKKLFPMQLLSQNLQNLKSLSVNFCDQLEYIVATDDYTGGEGGEQVTGPTTNTTSEVRLSKLKNFRLEYLPRLEYICKATMICDSIESVSVHDCPKVKRLPLFLPIHTSTGEPSPPKNLREIWASDEWWNSLEWDHPRAENALQPFLLKEMKRVLPMALKVCRTAKFNFDDDDDEDKEEEE